MNIKEITSLKNDLILKTKKLKSKKYRDITGTFIAEGIKNVRDSLKLYNAEMIFVANVNIIDFEFNCPCYVVSEQIMKELSDTVTPQGIVGVFKIKAFDEEKISDKIIVLNGVSDPGNVGTILRTACALGFSTVIADNKTADIYCPKIIRSAMSAVFALNILRCDDLEKTVLSFKEKGYSFYVSCLSEKSCDIKKVEFKEKCMLAVGNEANGVEESIIKLADTLYIIPMEKTIESLNVAVAAGISMYSINNASDN